MKRLISFSVVLLLLSASPVWAAYIYSAPSGHKVGTPWSLQPNTPGQQVMVYVTDGDAVAGFTFDVSIGDGGNGVVPPGVDVGPRITDIVLNGTGMVFAGGNQSTPYIPGSDGMYANTNVILPGVMATVPATGLLATLTIDTTGFSTLGQSWALAMDYNAPTPDTNFALAGGSVLYPTISNGALTIVPEPGTLVLLASLLALLPAVAWWRRKRLALATLQCIDLLPPLTAVPYLLRSD